MRPLGVGSKDVTNCTWGEEGLAAVLAGVGNRTRIHMAAVFCCGHWFAPPQQALLVVDENSQSVEVLLGQIRKRLRAQAMQSAGVWNDANEYRIKARSRAALGDRMGARHHLVMARHADRDYERALAQNANLERIVRTIDAAATNLELSKHMSAASVTLSQLAAQTEALDVDGIMAELRDQMGVVDEQGAMLAEPTTASEDDDALDCELAALFELPDAPRHHHTGVRVGANAVEKVPLLEH